VTSYLTQLLRTRDALHAVEAVEIAFQPIVSVTSLRTHGFEALTRMPQDAAFSDVLDLLDSAQEAGSLGLVERALLTKAITKFACFDGASDTRLFCNIDNRVFDDDAVRPEIITELMQSCGLQPANMCIELSERQPPNSDAALKRVVDVFLKHNVRIAIDDFGQGFSGLDTLMRVNPHYIKIDRAFVDGVASSPKQQAIISKTVSLAHSLGFLVVGEGVESEADFRMLRGIGCDFVQGFLIARPEKDITCLFASYDKVAVRDRRAESIPQEIADLLLPLPPILVTDDLRHAVDRFRQQPEYDFIPVVDSHGNVHGAIYGSDLSYYLFNEFGPALLANRGLDLKLASYIRRCPISDANARYDSLVESYVVAEEKHGLVITLDGRYQGILGNNAMLRLSAEREVALARDQNPLTFLPGNLSIQHHLAEVLRMGPDRTIVFFDFDHFKAFNDKYGFARGDRALQMFAERLLKFRHKHEAFVGHVGGDDFFASLPVNLDRSHELVRALTGSFQADVESLYSVKDRARGGLVARDRFGEERFFPLLRASAVLATLPTSRSHLTAGDIVQALADGKTRAKRSREGIAFVAVPETRASMEIAMLEDRFSTRPPRSGAAA